MKTKQSILKYVCVIGLGLVFSMSCSKDDAKDPNVPNPSEIADFNNQLAKLQAFSQEEEASEESLGKEDPEDNPDQESQQCVVERFKAAPGFNELLLLDPTTDVIYPGAMLKGESITTGEYIGINGGRAPITLSVSLQNIDGSSTIEIEDPKLSTVRESINSTLQQGVSGATAAKLNYTLEEVYSEEHLDIALGANYRGKNKSISGSFDFNSSKYKNKFVLKYIQEYYTIDMDLPPTDSPGSLFTSLPELNSTSPIFVSSVKYGRMVLYTIESDYEKNEINLAFAASYGDADAEAQVDHEKIISSSSINATVIGGSGADAAAVVIGPEGVYDYIINGGNYSADSPGAPLAYTLRYIKNGYPVAKVVLASEYNIRTCYEAYQKYGIQIYGLNCVENGDLDGNVELWGFMSAEIYQDGDRKGIVSYTRTRSNYIEIDEGFFFNIPTDDDTREIRLKEPDINKDYVILKGEYSENDVSSDDDYLGKIEEKILLKDIDYDGKDDYIRLSLNEDEDSDMRLYFYVWRVY